MRLIFLADLNSETDINNLCEYAKKKNVKYLINKKCKKIILGCTELPIAIFAYKSFRKAKESKLFIDPNLLLAEVCMKKYKN